MTKVKVQDIKAGMKYARGLSGNYLEALEDADVHDAGVTIAVVFEPDGGRGYRTYDFDQEQEVFA